MSKTTGEIQPVARGVFSLPPYDRRPPWLLGGWCPACNEYYFPRPPYCRSCLGPVQEVSLGSRGTIYSFTVIRTKAPFGLPTPYSVGYIDLTEKPLRVFCMLDPGAVDRLRVGQTVRLAVEPLGQNAQGEPCLRPFFTPCADEHTGEGL